MLNLSHQVVKDGEGATKFIEVLVEGAKRQKDLENFDNHMRINW